MYRNRDVIGHNAFSIVQTGAPQTNEQTLAQRAANTQQTVSVVPIHHHQPKANTLYMNTCCNISNIQYSHHQTNFRVRNKDIPIGTHHTLTYTHARPVYLLCVCGRCECGSIHLQSQFKRLPRNKKSELLQFIGFNSTTNSLHA